MKKIIAVFAIVLIIAILSFSCGASKVCPAYGSNDTEQTGGDNV
jgi:hypothetical protein